MQVCRVSNSGYTRYQAQNINNQQTNYIAKFAFGMKNIDPDDIVQVYKATEELFEKKIPLLLDGPVEGSLNGLRITFRKAEGCEVIPSTGNDNYIIKIMTPGGDLKGTLGYNRTYKTICTDSYGYFDSAAIEKWNRDAVAYLNILKKKS